jgi:predicted  nucleic acid-binding Zn-ribbon protein
VKPAQLLLQYQSLVERERALRDSIEKVEARLASDPEVVAQESVLESARSVQAGFAARLRESDRDREDHRAKLRSREKELMSGRIRNPTDLMQLSEEVAHMKSRFAEEEEDELHLMEEAETADEEVRLALTNLGEGRKQSAAEEPALKEDLETWRAELAEVVDERERVWSELAPNHQAAYSRVRAQPAVARVINNQCSACHVTVTSSGMQVLRKGDDLLQCDHCGRILVVA